MSTHRLPKVPSLRRQQLRLEFASLKTSPPPGIYVNISLTDPTLWSGVLFVQKGPYASAILRFKIRFPPTYPDLPPLITFHTDIFHPLLVPLTTYTFTTGSSDTDTVSATDEERLSPGGFSLRHGFPHWFGRAKRSAATSATSSRNVSGSESNDSSRKGGGAATTPAEERLEEDGIEAGTPRVSPMPSGPAPYISAQVDDIPVLNILNYVRSTFEDETVLDSITLEAAGNPGAWHAWRSHRRVSHDTSEDMRMKKGSSPQARAPGEWNWDGVWAKRVQSGIEASCLESVLFGGLGRGGSDDLIRFKKLDHDMLERVKGEMIPGLEELQKGVA
ncbi:hypothetical protein AJ80_00018 [Polytolypa hystricis UAMH7299]|uniref:UBC core domain-containing protein n=1 Tax=Polytolypa hystricis (strain UAMH7299) TaxID=1447883 RepID=A0A2B7Z4S5_POLH7|nr:hypothetical protein AJ80_00018 [Polytolypa hystricis UAMH7299]